MPPMPPPPGGFVDFNQNSPKGTYTSTLTFFVRFHDVEINPEGSDGCVAGLVRSACGDRPEIRRQDRSA